MCANVLIVDDSVLMRRMIGETLMAAGWEVTGEAGDGREAVEKYLQLHPDAVTMDIVMPERNGIQALEEILQIDPTARVVVISALNQTRMISEAIRKGAHDFIAKPFLPEQLQNTMAYCLSSGQHV